MSTPVSYRCRLRFLLQKKLAIQEPEYRLEVAGREVVLSAMLPDTLIADSDWLVMNIRGFESEQEAINYGNRLKAAVELSSVTCRLGVNAGIDKPTSGLHADFREKVEKETGTIIRSNVHGLDIFPDEPNVRIFIATGTGTVRSSADPFLADLDALHHEVESATQRAKDIVLLMNYALMRPEPVAQIIFSVSAVEMLGQELKWSDNQKRLLRELGDQAKISAIGSEEERAEVADAITMSLHRVSLRQGVLRLLDDLGMGHLKSVWDKLYAERSTLVHGLAPAPGVAYDDLARRTVNLCGQILLRAISLEIKQASNRVDTYYPLS